MTKLTSWSAEDSACLYHSKQWSGGRAELRSTRGASSTGRNRFFIKGCFPLFSVVKWWLDSLSNVSICLVCWSPFKIFLFSMNLPEISSYIHSNNSSNRYWWIILKNFWQNKSDCPRNVLHKLKINSGFRKCLHSWLPTSNSVRHRMSLGERRRGWGSSAPFSRDDAEWWDQFLPTPHCFEDCAIMRSNCGRKGQSTR